MRLKQKAFSIHMATWEPLMPATKVAALFTEISSTVAAMHEYRNDKDKYKAYGFALANQLQSLVDCPKDTYNERQAVYDFTRKLIETYLSLYVKEDLEYIRTATQQALYRHLAGMIAILLVVAAGHKGQDMRNLADKIYKDVSRAYRFLKNEPKRAALPVITPLDVLIPAPSPVATPTPKPKGVAYLTLVVSD